MSRYFLILGIFVALVLGMVALGLDKLLEGNFFERESTHAHEEDSILESSASGFIKSLGASAVVDSGTHLLEKEDGTTLLLIGLRVNLDSYVGEKATLRGRMAATPSGKQLMQVLSVDEYEEDDHSDTLDDPSWTAFTNGDLGVSFQKRGNWKLSTSPSEILFELPVLEAAPCETDPCPEIGPHFISIERAKNTAEPLKANQRTRVKNKIGVDMIEAEKIQHASGRVDFVVKRDDFLYTLSYKPDGTGAHMKYKNDFFQLLATFRFVPYY